MTRASRFLAALSATLPPERLQHDRVSRSERQIADAHGGIGRPYTVESTLGRMLRHGDINAAQWHAGTLFADLFQEAALDPLRAASLTHTPRGNHSDTPHGSDYARRRVNDALDALGGLASPIGSISWFVLGCELSLNQWAQREGWAGRPLRHETATITLIGALAVLASHFGTSR